MTHDTFIPSRYYTNIVSSVHSYLDAAFCEQVGKQRLSSGDKGHASCHRHTTPVSLDWKRSWCIHHQCDGPRDQADASLLDLVDRPGETPLVFFRSNRSPGNMSHSRITPHPLYKHNGTAPLTRECSLVPSCMSKAMHCPQAWLGGLSPHHTTASRSINPVPRHQLTLLE